jgi:two-component system alkaline phosphatase synthesis response regulator PhoP
MTNLAEDPAVEQAIVVDDDPVIRGILRSTLAGIGIGVHLASCGGEACTIARRIKADLFLLDLLMPRMNGLEACRTLRSMAAYANTPIVVLTGHHSEDAQAAAFDAGATMFLAKPFRPAIMLQALAPLLSGLVPGNGAGTQLTQHSDLWGQADPEYRNQLWGRLDARRTAIRLALGTAELKID